MREIDFLRRHKEWFKLHLCGCFPLSEEFLEKNCENLNWNYVSANRKLQWSTSLIDKFREFWSWESLNANETCVWTKELKKKYSDKYDRELDIRKRIESDENDQDEEEDGIDASYSPEEFRNIINNTKPDILSIDERVPWTEELIEKFQNDWDWGYLSLNRRLPWSESFINKYLDKWDFGALIKNQDGVRSYTAGLSDNSGLPWSLELIKKYESRWSWLKLSLSQYIPWSFEIIREFENRWEWDYLIWNEIMWQKVFYPFLDDKIIGQLLISDNEITS